MLNYDFLLYQRVDLLFEEVDLINITGLKFLEVFFEVGDIFNNFFKDVVSSLCSVMLESCAFASQELHFFLVVIQQFDSILTASLFSQKIKSN